MPCAIVPLRVERARRVVVGTVDPGPGLLPDLIAAGAAAGVPVAAPLAAPGRRGTGRRPVRRDAAARGARTG